MATFSFEIKKEISQHVITDPNLAVSQLSAIIKTCGEIQLKNKGWNIVLNTEFSEMINKINRLLTLLYGACATLKESSETAFNRKRFEITFPTDLSERILVDTEIMFYDEDKTLCLNNGISKYLIEDEMQMKAYLEGVVLGCFTCNITMGDNNKSSGYHVEFPFSSEEMSQDFCDLLSQFDIISKKIERKNQFVVYLKEFEQICSLLAICSATKSYLSLQNENTVREVRNNVNRQNNCYSGNVTKTVNASLNQLNAIKEISESIGIDSLDYGLQNACFLRLANPEESLEDLLKLSTDKITKSGLYNRFKKIMKIAKDIKD